MDNPLIELAVALPIVLLMAALIASGLRRLFGPARSLSFTSMTIVAVLGVSIGLLLSSWAGGVPRLWVSSTILLGVGASLGLSAVVAAVVAATRRDPSAIDLEALLHAGETDRTEFKETARWNVREDKKDPRMETAVAKTLAAFLNSRGGTLLIGVDDAGRPMGLERDLGTLRTADIDRFELWLRDMLSTSLGRNAAVLPRISFPRSESGHTVCAVTCQPAPYPVYVSRTQDGKPAVDLWVRVGNSSRTLPVDDAVAYVRRHWRPSLATMVLGRPSRR